MVSELQKIVSSLIGSEGSTSFFYKIPLSLVLFSISILTFLFNDVSNTYPAQTIPPIDSKPVVHNLNNFQSRGYELALQALPFEVRPFILWKHKSPNGFYLRSLRWSLKSWNGKESAQCFLAQTLRRSWNALYENRSNYAGLAGVFVRAHFRK